MRTTTVVHFPVDELKNGLFDGYDVAWVKVLVGHNVSPVFRTFFQVQAASDEWNFLVWSVGELKKIPGFLPSQCALLGVSCIEVHAR